MSVTIRPARLDADAGFLVSAVRRHLNPAADVRRFAWLYHRNPDGEARAWIAEDPAGRAVGMAAAFPRRVYLRGRADRAWVLGDFCVDDDHRTLGPALQLQRACLAGITATGAGLVYDLPGAAMLPVYRRLGIAPFGEMRRLAKPLRVDGRLGSALPAVVARPLQRTGNGVLAFLDRRLGVGGDVEVMADSGPCGPDYSDLASRIGAGHAFCLDRSAAYVTWRYLEAPHRTYRLLAARRRGRLVGWAALDRDGAAGWIVDLFGIDDRAVTRALVGAAVARFRTEGAATACATVLEGHAWASELRHLGFRPREATPVVVCGGDGRALAAGDAAGRPWLLVQGDRES
jgi:Acetyltransferase (GNAT) domain